MKIRIPEVSSVNFWLLLSLIMSFILEIMVQVGILTDSSWTKASQYVVLLLPVLFCFIQTIVNKINDGHNYVYEYEIKNGGVLASVFFIIYFMAIVYRRPIYFKFFIRNNSNFSAVYHYFCCSKLHI